MYDLPVSVMAVILPRSFHRFDEGHWMRTLEPMASGRSVLPLKVSRFETAGELGGGVSRNADVAGLSNLIRRRKNNSLGDG